MIAYDESGREVEIREQELLVFLEAVDELFPVPLSKKVSLASYALKLMQRATLIVHRDRGVLAAVAAGYTTNLPESRYAYLALLGVRPESQGRGIGGSLVQRFISIARRMGAQGVHLYTDPSNSRAIAMYHKLGFNQVHIPRDPRGDDVHFQITFEE